MKNSVRIASFKTTFSKKLQLLLPLHCASALAGAYAPFLTSKICPPPFENHSTAYDQPWALHSVSWVYGPQVRLSQPWVTVEEKKWQNLEKMEWKCHDFDDFYIYCIQKFHNLIPGLFYFGSLVGHAKLATHVGKPWSKYVCGCAACQSRQYPVQLQVSSFRLGGGGGHSSLQCIPMHNHRNTHTKKLTVKVVIFARVIFRASAIFDIFACF